MAEIKGSQQELGPVSEAERKRIITEAFGTFLEALVRSPGGEEIIAGLGKWRAYWADSLQAGQVPGSKPQEIFQVEDGISRLFGPGLGSEAVVRAEDSFTSEMEGRKTQ